MPFKFQVSDTVLVPANRMPHPDRYPHALVDRKVIARHDRSITVDDGEGGTVDVASRLVHSRNLGFRILRIGDLATEVELLDPLAKSILQFLRLLLPDDDLHWISLRTIAELRSHWVNYHGITSHVVIIGHGSSNSISFVDSGPLNGKELAQELYDAAPTIAPKVFVSLACLTGRAAFARPFSSSPICRDLIAPFHSVHGADASQFCQSFFASHLLGGTEIGTAYSRAKNAVVNPGVWRRWHNGNLYR